MNQQSVIKILKEYPLAIICSVLILAAVAISYLRGGAVETARKDLKDRAAQYDIIERNLVNYIGIEEELEKIKASKEKLAAKLIDIKTPELRVQHYQMLLNARDSSKVIMGDPNFGAPVPKSSSLTLTPQLNYTFRTSATVENSISFVEKFIHGQHIMLVDSITLRPQGDPVLRGVVMDVSITGLAK